MRMISLPLYVPHVGHTWWGSLGAWHCGHADARTGFRKSCARLMFFLDFECLFIGFGIMSYSFTLLFLRLRLKLLQCGEPFIQGWGLTLAMRHIPIGSAVGTQALAGIRTQRFDRDLKQDLFKDQHVQIDGILLIIGKVKIFGIQLPFLLRPIGRRGEGIFERGMDRQGGHR